MNNDFKIYNYHSTYDSDIKNFVKESSDIKRSIFKYIIYQTHTLTSIQYDLDKFIKSLNSLLNKWDVYTDELHDIIKRCGSNDITSYVIPYDDIKNYIYSNFDYASVLTFTDGIIKGINDGKFENKDDINDFYEDTISKAFSNIAEDIGELVGDATSIVKHHVKTTPYENKMFDTLKHNSSLFDDKASTEIYKACKKTLEYLVNIGTNVNINTINESTLMISIINTVIDYIEFTVTLYLTKIYTIWALIHTHYNTANDTEYTESNIIDIDNLERQPISIFRNFEDNNIQSIDDGETIIDTFKEYFKLIGIEYENAHNESSITGKMKTNELYAAISKYYTTWERGTDVVVNEINALLKSLIYNNKQALSSSNSDKQLMLNIIANIKCGSTSKECNDNMKDLYGFICNFYANIKSLIHRFRNIAAPGDHNPPIVNTVQIRNTSLENANMLNELYKDIMKACVNKARDIEAMTNKYNNEEYDSFVQAITIKVPGLSSDTKNNTNTLNSIPDTTRTSLDEMLQTESTFIYCEMYDDYLRTLPPFMNDEYYKEDAMGGSTSSIINKIYALLQAIIKRLNNFWKGKQLQNAIDWVKKNEQTLMTMTFNNDAKMEIIDYPPLETGIPNKNNVNVTGFLNELENFDPTKINNNEDIENFVRKLYPQKESYNYDAFKKDPKHAAALLQKGIFLKDTNTSDSSTETKEIIGSEISKYAKEWTAFLKNAGKISSQVVDEQNKINNAFKKFRDNINKAINAEKNNASTTPKTESVLYELGDNTTGGTGTTSQPEQQPPTVPTQSGDSKSSTGGTTNIVTTSTNTTNQNNGMKKANWNSLISKVMHAITNVYTPCTYAPSTYTIQIYKYLTEAYSIRKQSNTNTQTQASTNESQ